MPFKRKDSPYWQIRKYNLPGYGDTGAISTRVLNRSIAVRMESMLEDIAAKALSDTSWVDLLDAICDHTIALSDVMAAKSRGDLRALKTSLSDPLISTVIAQYRDQYKITRFNNLGLRLLEGFAGHEKMSKLRSKYIRDLCLRYEKEYGVKRNTAHRKLYQAIGAVLKFHYGKAEQKNILADVDYSKEDDTREVYISPSDISTLLQVCDDMNRPDFAVLIQMALITSADRGVLLAGKEGDRVYRGLLKKDITITQIVETGKVAGEVYLKDDKTTDRPRTIPLPGSICESLLVMCGQKAPNDPVFDIKYQSLKNVWSKIRKAAGFWSEDKGYAFTFKDLRAQTAIYAEEAGVPQTIIMSMMGHSSEDMTRRYQRRQAVISLGQVQDIASLMFGDGTNRITNTG